MFNRLHTYTVHTRPALPDEPLLTREGFSIFAFAFGGLWLLYNRVWLAGFTVLAISLLCEWMQANAMLHETSLVLAQVVLALFVGLEGREMRRDALEARGYQLSGIVCAQSEDHALLRHYEHQAA